MALFLQKHCPQLEINIYEAAHELAEIGAGVGIWPRVWEILHHLGLEEDLRKAIGEDSGKFNLILSLDS